MVNRFELVARRLVALSVGVSMIALGSAAVQGEAAPGSAMLIAVGFSIMSALAAIPSERFVIYGLFCTVWVPSLGVAYLVSTRIDPAMGVVMVIGGAMALVLAAWPRRDREALPPPSSARHSSA